MNNVKIFKKYNASFYILDYCQATAIFNIFTANCKYIRITILRLTFSY